MTKANWNPLVPMLGHEEFLAYHMVSENGYDMPLFHTHNHYEFYLFLEGNVCLTIEGQVLKPEPYTLFIYPPGLMHRCTTTGEMERYERAYAYSTVDFLKSVSTQDYPMMQIIESAVEKQIYAFKLNPTIGARIIEQMDEIIQHMQLSTPAEQLFNRCRMTMLLISICQCIDATLEDRSSTYAPIHHIIGYINEHLADSLTLDDLAARFYTSKYALLRTFKEHTKMSVRQYIISKRIIHAQMLMRAGATPGEAARASGFNDYAGFYRSFLKQTGVTPQKFSKDRMNEPM